MKKTVFFLLIFLVIGRYMIANSLQTDFNEKSDKVYFAKTFAGWAFDIGKNTKDVVDYAADKDWLPEVNDTNNTNSSED